MPTKPNTSRRGSSQRGGAKRSPKSTSTRKQSQAQRLAQQQMHAIVLFALGILLATLTLIKGSSAWLWLHNALFSLFGMGALFVALVLIYIAILLTMDKPYKARVFLCSLTVLCFCAALQIFRMEITADSHVLDLIIDSMEAGIRVESGGLFGTILGLPLQLLFGKLGGGIIIILLLLVLLMLLSGATLIGLARAAHKPIKTIESAYADQMVRQEERAAQRAEQTKQPPRTKVEPKSRPIDIPLDGEASPQPPPEVPNQPKPTAPPTGERRRTKPEPPPAPIASPPEPEPTASPPSSAEARKFEIDIPLDDDFRPSETGGFALGMAGEAMEFVSSPEPTLDQLVSSAATQSGKFTFQGTGEKEASPPEEMLVDLQKKLHVAVQTPPEEPAFRLNLPPELDVDPPGERPFQEEPFQNTVHPPVPTEVGSLSEVDGEELPPSRPAYRKPPMSLLREVRGRSDVNTDEMKANAQLLVDTLASFGVQTRIVDISRGPAVTRYELQPSAGVKISKITGLSDDIALNLASAGVRIEAPIPNKAAVGIEVPNKTVSAVTLREITDSPEFRNAKSKLTVALGRDIAGKVTLADVAKMPHLLIAGSTGSGKSVCINSIIMSLLFQAEPDEVRFLMIDPKVVELGVYNGIPHLLVPVVTDPKKAAGALSWAVTEMLKRYKLFADNSVRDLGSFNALADRMEGMERMPQVVIIIDELADLMMAAPNEIEDYICRLAQMARAAGMHLIIATQRPSVDVITGVIKANIPSRIAFAVSSQIDSRTILDMGGAEKLLGRGDMLFNPIGSAKPIRVQGCFVTDEEIEAVISFIKNDATSDYDQQIVEKIDSHVVAGKGSKGASSGGDSSSDGSPDDEMLLPAIECVVEAGMASTSLLQRRLKLGYARAARIVDEMEQRGIVGPFEGSKPRQVLLSPERLAELKVSQELNR